MGKSVQKDKNTFKHSSSKRVEIDEAALQKMLLGKELPIGDVAQNGPKQDDAEPTIRNKTVGSKTEPREKNHQAGSLLCRVHHAHWFLYLPVRAG